MGGGEGKEKVPDTFYFLTLAHIAKSNMKFTKQKLVDCIRSEAGGSGFKLRLPASRMPILYKRLGDLILTVGIEFSRHYDAWFTGSFYLSRSFEWSFIPRGFPRAAYQRVSHFLVDNERQRLLDEQFCKDGVVDGWWIGFSEETCRTFTEALTLCEPRFLAQKGIREALFACERLSEHVAILEQTILLTGDRSVNIEDKQFEPIKHSKGIPTEWFWAAEKAVRERRPDLLSKEYIVLVATDAWRWEHLY